MYYSWRTTLELFGILSYMDNKTELVKEYSFLSKKHTTYLLKVSTFRYTAVGTLLGFVSGILAVALFPDFLINLFGFIGLCSVNSFTLQTCNPIPYTVTIFLALLSGMALGFLIDIFIRITRRS